MTLFSWIFLTPQVGFEPTTNRLTADRSTTELLRIANSYTNGTREQLASILPNFFDNFSIDAQF